MRHDLQVAYKIEGSHNTTTGVSTGERLLKKPIGMIDA